MVQIHQRPRKTTPSIRSQLAGALGQGLASFTGNYLANKALTQLTETEDYKKAPLSEKLNQLTTKLQPYGGFGKNALVQHLQVEQQKQEERKNFLTNKLIKGEELTEEEAEELPPEIQLQKKKIDAAVKKAEVKVQAKKAEEEKEIAENEAISNLVKEGALEGKAPHEVWGMVYDATKNAKKATEWANNARMTGREQRITLDSIRKTYDKELKDIKAEIKDATLPEQQQPLIEKLNKLEKMKKKDLNRYNKGERDFDLEIDREMLDEAVKEPPPQAAQPVKAAQPAKAAQPVKTMEEEEEEQKDPKIIKLTELYPPAEWAEKTKRDKQTGNLYKSDGVKWSLVQ